MEPAQQTTDPNRKFYIALAVMGFIIIALAAAVIIVAVNKNNTSVSGSNGSTGSIQSDAFQRSRRNTQRHDDLSSFLTAANNFQANNNGKLPWSGDYMFGFVKRYIDTSCNSMIRDDIASGDSNVFIYDCDGDEFRDPDGNAYKFWLLGSMDDPLAEDYFDGDVAAVISGWPNDYRIMVVTYAGCGNEGETVRGSSERQYAMLYVNEDDGIICYDNH